MNLDIIYDHYKDTFQYLSKYIKQRDRYFFYLMTITTLVILFLHNSNNFSKIINTLLQHKFDKIINIDIRIINTFLIFSFLAIIIKYIQVNLLIENQYIYISKLEDEINTKIYKNTIQREGKSYLKNYPIVKNIIHFCYTIIIPSFLILTIFFKLKQEFIINNEFNLFIIIDTLICIIALIIIIFYIYHLYKEIKLFNSMKLFYFLLILITGLFVNNLTDNYQYKFITNIVLYNVIVIILIFCFNQIKMDNK